MQDYTIKRTGQAPLKFTGSVIGQGSTYHHTGPNQNRWTEVLISCTKRGKYVACVENHSQQEGERTYTKAQTFGTAAEVIAYLRVEGGGDLGRASQKALKEAALNDDGSAEGWVERVD